MPSMRTRVGAALVASGVLISGVLVAGPASSAVTRSVCAIGCDFTAIGAAVAAATAGDTIEVRGGVYTESVLVDKQLTVRGTPGTVVLPGPSYNDAGFRLQADGVTIEGFTIGDRSVMSQTVGIDVSDSAGARIEKVILVNNQRGVSLSSGASDVVVYGTRFANNNGGGPNNNAGLWGNGVTGIRVELSSFVGHTNTAINLDSSADITITKSRFSDNANLAVIWNDTNVTISRNAGTLMRSSAVYLNKSRDVQITRNLLVARGDASAGVAVSNVTGPNSGVQVTGNVLRGFLRSVNVAGNGASDSVVVKSNRLLGTEAGVRNQGSPSVDARDNWWGAASGPSDAVIDASTPASNPGGTGTGAVGAVDYRNWCGSATCVTPPPPPPPVPAPPLPTPTPVPAPVSDPKAKTKLKTQTVTKKSGALVLKVRVKPTSAVEGAKLDLRKDGKRLARHKVKGGKVTFKLGKPNSKFYRCKLVFNETATASRIVKELVIRVN